MKAAACLSSCWLAALTISNNIFAWQTDAITRVSTNQPRTSGVDVNFKF